MSVLPRPEGLVADEALMRCALAVAGTTPPGDVPVGALVVDHRGRELGRGVNRREADGDPTAHAEVLALRQATARAGDGWRLERCTLVVTLEPCAMCAGAIVGARVGRLVFGAFEPKTGACGSTLDVVRDASALHHPEVRGGVLEEDCARLLAGFFAACRGPRYGAAGYW